MQFIVEKFRRKVPKIEGGGVNGATEFLFQKLALFMKKCYK